MAAAKGNEYYKNRKKDGRDPIFKNSIQLEDISIKYFEEVKNTFEEVETLSSKGVVVKLKKQIPPLKETFAEFAGAKSWETIKEQKVRGKDFSEVVTRIENKINGRKKQGAYIGIFNPNIVMRDLGMAETTENKHEVTEIRIKHER